MKYPQMKAAIFDVDGTLLDSMGIWESVGERYLDSLGVQAEENLWEILFTMSIEEGASYLNKHYHLQKTDAEVAQGIVDIVRDFYYEEAELKEGVRQLLEYLDSKDILMAIATSSERGHIEHAFKRLGIWHYFKAMYTCSEERTAKRESPLIYQRASEYLGVAAADTYVFEDVLHAVETAKKAGYVVVGVYDRYSENDQEQIRKRADLYLQSLEEYSSYIE